MPGMDQPAAGSLPPPRAMWLEGDLALCVSLSPLRPRGLCELGLDRRKEASVFLTAEVGLWCGNSKVHRTSVFGGTGEQRRETEREEERKVIVRDRNMNENQKKKWK